jgi:tRNA threonylcarbamoyladenosine biosynthesis protein TsaB
MHILAIETTGPHCSVAIIDETGRVREASSKGTMNHLQFLMPLTKQLLTDCQLQLDDIDVIAVSAGPGSFTGIRIGVSSARGLAQVLGCKVTPVETLKAFAYNVPEYQGLICPIFDARRNQVYGGAYLWQDGEILEAVPGGPYMLDEYLELLEQAIQTTGNDRVQFFGDGLKPYGQKVEAWASGYPIVLTIAPEEHRYQEAGSVAKLGLAETIQGNASAYETVFPNYLRIAEAQKNLDDRLEKEAKEREAKEKENEAKEKGMEVCHE